MYFPLLNYWLSLFSGQTGLGIIFEMQMLLLSNGTVVVTMGKL